MPFVTYSIREDSFDKLTTKNKRNYEKFIINIEILNRKKRAILVNEKYDNLKKKIKDKISSLDKPKKILSLEIEQAKKIAEDASTEAINYNTNQDLLEKEFLNSCLICFNSSYKSNSIVKKENIDFEKDSKNELNSETFDYFNRDVIGSTEFKTLYDFKDKYLKKIEIFIKSISSEEIETKGLKKKIDSITIFHKELSKYLIPSFSFKNKKLAEYQLKKFLDDSITNNQNKIISNNLLYVEAKEESKKFKDKSFKDKKHIIKKYMDNNLNIKENVEKSKYPYDNDIIQITDPYYSVSVKKIEAGTKFLLEWWHNLPDEIKPKKFNIITDIPPQLQNVHYADRNTFLLRAKEFLTKDYSNNLFKPEIFFLNRNDVMDNINTEKPWQWKHKKHFVFSNKEADFVEPNKEVSNISLLIGSEYGVEFADPNFHDYKKEKGNIKMNPDNNDFTILKNNNHHYKQIKTLFTLFPKKCGI